MSVNKMNIYMKSKNNDITMCATQCFVNIMILFFVFSFLLFLFSINWFWIFLRRRGYTWFFGYDFFNVASTDNWIICTVCVHSRQLLRMRVYSILMWFDCSNKKKKYHTEPKKNNHIYICCIEMWRRRPKKKCWSSMW